MSVLLLVEGGGDGKDLRVRCRRGFSELVKKLGLAGRMPRVDACGSRAEAFRDFCTAMRSRDASAILLVDSEAPVHAASPWQHLRERPGDAWERPEHATDDQCHLMVQCMESWLVADPKTVARFFGAGFQDGALPANPDIEQVAKTDVLDRLVHATRDCSKQYTKSAVAFSLLAEVDPQSIRARSRKWAARFFDAILAACRAGR